MIQKSIESFHGNLQCSVNPVLFIKYDWQINSCFESDLSN